MWTTQTQTILALTIQRKVILLSPKFTVEYLNIFQGPRSWLKCFQVPIQKYHCRRQWSSTFYVIKGQCRYFLVPWALHTGAYLKELMVLTSIDWLSIQALMTLGVASHTYWFGSVFLMSFSSPIHMKVFSSVLACVTTSLLVAFRVNNTAKVQNNFNYHFVVVFVAEYSNKPIHWKK